MVIKKYNGGQKNKHKKCSICHQELSKGEYYLSESGGKHECRFSYCGSKLLKTIIEEMQLLHNELQKCGKNALDGNRGKNGTSMSEVSEKGEIIKPEPQQSEPGENIPTFIAYPHDEKSKTNINYTQSIPIIKKMPKQIILQVLSLRSSYEAIFINKQIIEIYFDEIIKEMESKSAEKRSKGEIFHCMAYNKFISLMEKAKKELLKIK